MLPVAEYSEWRSDRRQQKLSAVLPMQVNYQHPDDMSENPAPFQRFKSEQAQLIADLQHRLDHLAGVTAGCDDYR